MLTILLGDAILDARFFSFIRMLRLEKIDVFGSQAELQAYSKGVVKDFSVVESIRKHSHS